MIWRIDIGVGGIIYIIAKYGQFNLKHFRQAAENVQLLAKLNKILYALIFGGGLTRLPSFMRSAMRYSLRSDFTSCSMLGAVL